MNKIIVAILLILTLSEKVLSKEITEKYCFSPERKISVTGGNVIFNEDGSIQLSTHASENKMRVEFDISNINGMIYDTGTMEISAPKGNCELWAGFLLDRDFEAAVASGKFRPNVTSKKVIMEFSATGIDHKLHKFALVLQTDNSHASSKVLIKNLTLHARGKKILPKLNLPDHPHKSPHFVQLKREKSASFLALVKKFKTEINQIESAKLLRELYQMQNIVPWEYEQKILNDLLKKQPLIWAVGNGIDKISRQNSFPGKIMGNAYCQLAKNESEGIQIALYSSRDLFKVSFHCSVLSLHGNSSSGEKRTITPVITPVAYIKGAPFLRYHNDPEQWIADPVMVGMDEFNVPKENYQPVLVEFYADFNQAAGVYTGNIEVKENNKKILNIPIKVRVRNFTLPKSNTLPIAITNSFRSSENGNFQKLYCKDPEIRKEVFNHYLNNNHKDFSQLSNSAKKLAEISEQAITLLKNHRIPDTNFYRSLKNPVSASIRQEHKNDKTLFCLGSVYNGGADTELLRPQVEAAAQEGSLPYAYVYGFDEIRNERDFENMLASFESIKNNFPDLKTMSTAWDYSCGDKLDLWRYTDIWVLPSTIYRIKKEQVNKARQRGQQVWWYVCDYPLLPYANIFLENSGTATRLLMGIMPWKFNVEGFLYYGCATWNSVKKSNNLSKKWKNGLSKNSNSDKVRIFSEMKITPSSQKRMGKIYSHIAAPLNSRIQFTIIVNGKNNIAKKYIFKHQILTNEDTLLKSDFQVLPDCTSITASISVNNKSAVIKDPAVEINNLYTFITEPLTEILPQELLISTPLPGVHTSGSGSLVLPIKNGVIPTLRLKLIRDGLEDYEYLNILSNKIKEVKSRDPNNLWIKKAQSTINNHNTLYKSLKHYTNSGEDIINYRNKIANLIESSPK